MMADDWVDKMIILILISVLYEWSTAAQFCQNITLQLFWKTFWFDLRFDKMYHMNALFKAANA